jgi:hypothetical protein
MNWLVLRPINNLASSKLDHWRRLSINTKLPILRRRRTSVLRRDNRAAESRSKTLPDQAAGSGSTAV